MEKMEYQTPTLTVVGTFEQITQGGTTGTSFDGNFVAGQPVPFNPAGQPIIFS
jgi:hypothetical protein